MKVRRITSWSLIVAMAAGMSASTVQSQCASQVHLSPSCVLPISLSAINLLMQLPPPAGGKTQGIIGKPTTRAKIAQVIYNRFGKVLNRRAGNLPTIAPFHDVVANGPDYQAIDLLARYSIVTGDSAGNFQPHEQESRFELAMSLDRLLSILKPNLQNNLLNGKIDMPKDIPATVESYSAVERMLKLGVILPFTDGYFRGKRPTTDAEVKNALARINELVGTHTDHP